MNKIVTLHPEEVRVIARALAQAAADGNSVRVAVDGGFKFSVAQRMWTAPIGEVKS
jgi:hypothetical protein